MSEGSDVANFESPNKAPRLITSDAAVETLALFAGCLAFAEFMTGVTKGTAIQLPTFVWALSGGVVIRTPARASPSTSAEAPKSAMVRTRTASSSWVRLSLLLVGASFWAVPVRVRVPIAGPVPAEPLQWLPEWRARPKR